MRHREPIYTFATWKKCSRYLEGFMSKVSGGPETVGDLWRTWMDRSAKPGDLKVLRTLITKRYQVASRVSHTSAGKVPVLVIHETSMNTARAHIQSFEDPQPALMDFGAM